MACVQDMNLRYIKGIGEARAQCFAKLGVYTVGGLLSYFPRAYQKWIPISIMEAPLNTEVCIRAIVSCSPVVYKRSKGRSNVKVSVTDGPGIVDITFFNNEFVAQQLVDGIEYLFYGKITTDDYGSLQMLSPKFEEVENSQPYHPVYPLTAGLNSKIISKCVKNALDFCADNIPDILPDAQKIKYRLPSEREAVCRIHFPQSELDIENARRRLIFEELLILQLGLKMSAENGIATTKYSLKKDYSDKFESLLPFMLTSAQKRTIRECINDMSSGMPMRRLIQGDVGSGKTAVAASLCFTMARNGFQSVVMAPTEVLAQQHFHTFSAFFENTGIHIALLTGFTPAKERKILLQELETGQIAVLIGTNAVLSKGVQFCDLGLCITDEQHRFGVKQRADLRAKGIQPHVLVMSATPIPRTLSLIIYGDLALSVLDEKPKGRLPIKTYCVPSSYHERIYAFIKKQLDEGQKAYIVCPMVEKEDSENENSKLSAEETMKQLSRNEFSDYKTALIHGKMKQSEKNDVMLAFANGDVQLLICTVVIEVGIDVPLANVIVIENADCFGLSQLHQLRGRTGRGGQQSYCILVSDAQNEEALKRLQTMVQTQDGFKIAEEDLKFRGPGDFFGARQSGLPKLKIADLMTDTRILYAARDEAQKILSEDPTLSLPKNKGLREKSKQLFADIS